MGVERLLSIFRRERIDESELPRKIDESNCVINISGGYFDPDSVIAKIYISEKKYCSKARSLLERSGGYVFYGKGLYGVRYKSQLTNLVWRFIPYKIVENKSKCI